MKTENAAKEQKIEDYENKDPRCQYPFEPMSLGYCWSYAHYVDGDAGFEDIESVCKNCELWQDE